MSAIFESILHMSAVGGIVIITVVIVRFFLKNAPKLYSYLLWAIVLLRLLCPFTLQSPLSTIPENLTFDEAIEKLSEPRTQSYIEAEPVIQPNPVEIGNMELDEMYRSDIEASYENVPAGSIAPAPGAKTDWLHILSIVWLCGLCVMAVWSLVVYIRLKIRLREAMVFDNGVYLTDKVGSPFVLGILRPRIYLPASLSSEEWDYIVLHERCHIRRGDHITRVLAFAAMTLHWFNPLVWLAFILSGKDMEMSCDEAVLRSMGPEVRKAYSTSLLSLATGRPILSGMPLAFGEGDTKGRIRNLAKWRKPTLAMIIAAVIVCIVAAVCLLTDPVEREAQIRVDGRVYTYTGSEENPAGIIWELGMLEGIVHRSSKEPEEDFHGTNLDEKYAGQPLYACLDGRIYLFDEEGYFLPFELPKGDIVSGPIEVDRGDFNRDGWSDFITVTEYSNSVEIILADSVSAKTLWADTASLVEGQQKCIIARKDEDGDSIIRYTFHEEGYCNYIRFFIGGDGELDVEKGRSPVDHLLEASFTDPEAISASLPENSTFLLSTYGGEVVIGPIKGGGGNAEAELGLERFLREIETDDIAGNGHYYRNNFQAETLASALNALGEPSDIVFGGEIVDWSYLFRVDGESNDVSWLYLKCGLFENLVQIVLEIEDKQQTVVYENEALYTLLRHSRDIEDNIDPAVSPEIYAAAETLMRNGLDEYAGNPAQFVDVELTTLVLHGGYERSDGSKVELYDFAYALIPGKPEKLIIAGGAVMDGGLRVHGTGVSYMAVEYRDGKMVKYAPLWGGYFFPKGVLGVSDIETIENVLNSGIDIPPADAIIDDGSDVIAVPYGENIVIDLDGDGVEEVLRIKASNIYGVDSITVNGNEYLDQLEGYLGTDLNPEPDRFPNYYIVRTYKGDYSPKICIFDDGPSGDPKTHFFTFDHRSSLQYHGCVPCHVSNLSFDGNHRMTGPARLDVFQTWYAEHTWVLPNNGTKVRDMEQDFYYVDDFEFIYYPKDGVYYPPSKYTPLLCDVYAYEKMDISAEPLILKEGTKLSILGTDDKEWLLVANTAGMQYYLHLSGINACAIYTPKGETMGNSVFNGLNYAD